MMRGKVSTWLKEISTKEDNYETLIPKTIDPSIYPEISVLKRPLMHYPSNDELDSISKRTGEDGSHFMSGFQEVLGISALQVADRSPFRLHRSIDEESKGEF